MKIKDKIIYVTVATAMGINMIPMNTFALEENKNPMPIVDKAEDKNLDKDTKNSNVKSENNLKQEEEKVSNKQDTLSENSIQTFSMGKTNTYANNEIQSINLNFKMPVSGEKNKAENGYKPSVNPNADYTIESYGLMEKTDFGGFSPSTFKSDTDYVLSVYLYPKEGKTFQNGRDITLILNGTELNKTDFIENGFENGKYYINNQIEMGQDGSTKEKLTIEYYYHTEAIQWLTNETHHWFESKDSQKESYGEHIYDNRFDTTCNVCGYTRPALKKLENVNIDFELPVNGMSKSLPVVDENENYTLESSYVDGKLDNHKFYIEGNDYKLTMILIPKDGYYFKSIYDNQGIEEQMKNLNFYVNGTLISKDNWVDSGELLDGQYNISSVTYNDETGICIEYTVKAKSYEIEINEENFPDPFFRNYVKTLPGAEDGKFTKQELDTIEYVDLQGNGAPVLYTLEGIEYFENLNTLNITGTELESVDLSKNKKLSDLTVGDNKLKYLDLSNNPELSNLYCCFEQLTSLDLSKNTKLTTFKLLLNKRAVPEGFSLSELPGFDKSKVSNIQGGNFDGDKVNFTSNTITYTYDCGNGKSAIFTLEKIDGVNYTVKHLQQQLDGTYSEVTADTQTLKGVTGEKTSGVAKTYEGFTAQEFDQKTISNNGTILEIKYDRNSHNITWNLDGGSATNKYTSGEVLYGTEIVVPEVTKEGYDFVGWDATVAKTMPDEDVTYAAVWQKAHNHVLTLKKGKAATCTEAGYKDYYECECGKFFEDAEGKKIINNLEEWKAGDGKLDQLAHILAPVNGVSATCQKEGLKSYLECTTCKKVFDPKTKEEITNLEEWRKIPKLEHDLTKIDQVEPTEDKDGIKEYYQCNMCKKYYSDAQGKNEIDDLEAWKKGAGKLEKISHTLKAVEGLKQTCDKDGFKPYYQCEKCNKYFEDANGTKEITNLEQWKQGEGKLDKLGHNLRPITGNPATCQHEGLKSYLECKTCGKAFDENTKEEITNLEEYRKIPKLEHDLKKIDKVEPTFDKDGIKEYYQCNMCKKYYSDAQGKNEIDNLEAWKKGAGKLEKLPTYQIIEGMNSTWNKGSKDGLTFKSDGEFEEFIGVAVDGLMIDKKDYTAKDGSTIVTLSPEYLETLKPGKHTFDMVYQSGICGTSFEITNVEKPNTKPDVKPEKPDTKLDVKPTQPQPKPEVKPTKPNSKTPTSVMTNSGIWLSLAGLSAALGSILTFKKRNKK